MVVYKSGVIPRVAIRKTYHRGKKRGPEFAEHGNLGGGVRFDS
jgi:hypothetical protein